MSEKRRRQQDRRSKRQANRRGSGGIADRELAGMMDRMVEVVLRNGRGIESGLEAECWASDVIATWADHNPLSSDGVNVFLPAFVRALERRGTEKALSLLRALTAVGGEAITKRSSAAADRLSARQVREPRWLEQLGRAQPRRALLIAEETFDDGLSVLIEFVHPAEEAVTCGIYVDHNLGGLVKDLFLVGVPLDEVQAMLRERAPAGVGLVVRELDLAEARARVHRALEILERTLDPPVDDEVWSLRALLDTWITRLPHGFELPAKFEDFSSEERDQLLGEFLDSRFGKRWRADEVAADAAETIIDFGADYNYGGPLRWSPVVVEIFMVSWLPRKITGDDQFFSRIADVLPDWVSFAARTRAVPDELLLETTAAVAEYRQAMLNAVNDPTAWGPAKAFATAAMTAGIDLADQTAVDQFIDRYNQALAS